MWMRYVSVLPMSVVFLAGCASAPSTQRLAQHQADVIGAAGAPVASIDFFMPWSWERIDAAQVVVYSRAGEAWLVDLNQGCQDFGRSQSLLFSASMNRIKAGFDTLSAVNVGPTVTCQVRQIRPLDVVQLRASERARTVAAKD